MGARIRGCRFCIVAFGKERVGQEADLERFRQKGVALEESAQPGRAVLAQGMRHGQVKHEERMVVAPPGTVQHMLIVFRIALSLRSQAFRKRRINLRESRAKMQHFREVGLQKGPGFLNAAQRGRNCRLEPGAFPRREQHVAGKQVECGLLLGWRGGQEVEGLLYRLHEVHFSNAALQEAGAQAVRQVFPRKGHLPSQKYALCSRTVKWNLYSVNRP